jgi:4-hydroxyproline betaine 2-epimerase
MTPRIAEVHLHQLDLPVVGGSYGLASGPVTALDSTLVRLVTDTGVTGWGEACPIGTTYQPQHAGGVRAALTVLAPALVGTSVLGTGPAHAAMDHALAGHTDARAAVDIAVWDVFARSLGVRVCDVLGGAVVERVPAYHAFGVMDPDGVAAAVGTQVDAGFRRLQLKVGGRPLDEDLAAIRAAAAEVPPEVQLVVDANRGWDGVATVTVSRQCRDLPLVIEQPVATLAELRRIRGRLVHPVLLDESTTDLETVLAIVDEGLCDGFGLKVTRLGGLTPMATVRDVCRVRGLPHTVDDTWGSDVIAAAQVQLAATVSPDLLAGVWLAAPYVDGHLDVGGGITADRGWIDVPAGPGLGVTPDPERLGPPIASWD